MAGPQTPPGEELVGRVALVTGASGGIGRAITALFEARGAVVVAADIALDPSRPHDRTLALDVRDEQAWTTGVAEVMDRHGRLDILVNNAGMFSIAPIEEETVETFMAMVQVNQVGVFLGMKTSAPRMKAAGGGSIINISSAAGLIGSPRTIAYSATKWAVRGMTKVAATEFAAFGIRVNSIHPSAVDTPMVASIPGLAANAGKGTPLGRMATAEEIAHMALFLASDASGFSTGSEFVSDGGLTAA